MKAIVSTSNICEIPAEVQDMIKGLVPMAGAGSHKGGYDFDLLRAAMGRENENVHTKVLPFWG